MDLNSLLNKCPSNWNYGLDVWQWITDVFRLVDSTTREQFVYAARSMKTGDYERTFYWRIIRSQVFRTRVPRCERCGGYVNLQVHHRGYDFVGRDHEHLENLRILCRRCHENKHLEQYGLKSCLHSLGPEGRKTFENALGKVYMDGGGAYTLTPFSDDLVDQILEERRRLREN